MANLNELDRLEAYLKVHDFTYTRDDDNVDRPYADWHQIIVYKRHTNCRVWDAVCHCGSYGYRDGLIEVYGDIVPNREKWDGCLTADAVIDMIENCKDKERAGVSSSITNVR